MSTIDKKHYFGLLVWNVHKENTSQPFKKTFSSLLQRFEPDILLLQEVVLNEEILHTKEFHQEKGANIVLPTVSYGVLSASKVPILNKERLQTQYKEFFIATKKSLLITTHSIANHSLTVVNLHAINFVPHIVFKIELKILEKKLHHINTPLIVAGDFNTWSKRRLKTLQSFAQKLGLEIAHLEDCQHIKSYQGKQLDHILYRSLTLQKAMAVDTQDVSDHNALYALFEYNCPSDTHTSGT